MIRKGRRSERVAEFLVPRIDMNTLRKPYTNLTWKSGPVYLNDEE